jgi:hypothetical protein
LGSGGTAKAGKRPEGDRKAEEAEKKKQLEKKLSLFLLL